MTIKNETLFMKMINMRMNQVTRLHCLHRLYSNFYSVILCMTWPCKSKNDKEKHMEMIRCEGSHYEIGFQRALALKRKQLFVPERYESYLHAKRFAYAEACERIYAQYDLELLKEMHGFCDALHYSYERLCAFLFGMYAMNADVFCSCVALCDEKETMLGRNSDFLKTIAPFAIHEQINGLYHGNTTAFIELEDGMNVHGLAIGLTYVRSKRITVGYNGGLMVRHLLAHCENVNDAIAECRRLPVGSSFTLTMADRLGDIALLECCCDHMAIERSTSYVYALNRFHHQEMEPYQSEECPDDLHSSERLATMRYALSAHATHDQSFLRRLLKGSYGFLCQYPSACPADTLWSVIYSCHRGLTHLCIGNPRHGDYRILT